MDRRVKLETLFQDEEIARLYQQYRINYDNTQLSEEIITYLRQKLSKEPGSIAVDVACGTGFLTRVLAPHFTRVIGVDCSEAQLRVAGENTTDTNIEYRVGFGENLDFIEDSSVDLVTIALGIAFLKTDQLFPEVDRILRPGGILVYINYEYRVGKQKMFLKPETSDATVIQGCQAVMDEMIDTATPFSGINMKELIETHGGVPAPEAYEPHHVIVPAARVGNIETVLGYMRAMGAIRAYMKYNPEKGDIVEVYGGRIMSLLSTVSSIPEEVQFEIGSDFQCHMFRKPSPNNYDLTK